MITDDERREVAERMRVYSHDFEFGDSHPFWYVVKAAFGDVDAHTCYSVFARLADLIDRPTCHDVSDIDNEAFKCSRCGYRVLSLGGDICDAVVVSPDGLISDYYYCPNCGAMVTEVCCHNVPEL